MHYDLVTIVGSRRGLAALRHLLSELPSSFSAPIVCLVESHAGLVKELQCSRLKVRWAERGMRIEKGHVYISKPDESLVCLSDGTFGVAPYGPQNSAMNPVDRFLGSAAHCHGSKLLSLVLSGFDQDGVEGCESAKRNGGTVLVLDRATAHYWGMAEPIVQAGAAHRVLTIAEVAEALRGCFTSQDLLRCAEIQLQLGELLEAAMRLSGSSMGHVTRRARDSDKLRIIVQRGLGLDFFEQFEAMPVDCDAAWCQAVRFGHRVVIPDIASEPSHPAHAFSRRLYNAEISVPLVLPSERMEPHGAMTAMFAQAHRPLPRESSDLDHFAAQAAALVARVP